VLEFSYIFYSGLLLYKLLDSAFSFLLFISYAKYLINVFFKVSNLFKEHSNFRILISIIKVFIEVWGNLSFGLVPYIRSYKRDVVNFINFITSN
jgi:hypothetical protein